MNIAFLPRIAWCFVTSALYQLATNPILQAGLLVLAGHWRTGLAVLAAYWLLMIAAVASGITRPSRFGGRQIFTARRVLFLFGNEEEGWTPDWYRALHPRWPTFLLALVFGGWRNKFRNLPFVTWLAWLHRPRGALNAYELTVGGVLLEVWWRGWMTEFRWSRGRYFGDIGPRLDQPDTWGGISWACRPFGRY